MHKESSSCARLKCYSRPTITNASPILPSKQSISISKFQINYIANENDFYRNANDSISENKVANYIGFRCAHLLTCAQILRTNLDFFFEFQFFFQKWIISIEFLGTQAHRSSSLIAISKKDAPRKIYAVAKIDKKSNFHFALKGNCSIVFSWFNCIFHANELWMQTFCVVEFV